MFSKLISLSLLFCFLQKEPQEMIIDFINSEKYSYSSFKEDIPKFALDYLGKTEKNKNKSSLFKIGDSTELKDISLTDSFIEYSDGTLSHKYTRKLNFVLYNDSTCLMSYVSNQFDVIDFIKKEKDTIKHIRYNLSVFVNNLDSLKLAFSDMEKIPYSLIINTYE